LSLLTYAASSANTNALSNETLLVLNVIWFITAGTSLFFARGIGIVAVISDAVKPENLKEENTSDFSRRKSPRWSYGFAITFSLLLCGMVVGIVILLDDGVIVNTQSTLPPQS
jgi:uncharacterized ion transporter superfamily protein YfcC